MEQSQGRPKSHSLAFSKRIWAKVIQPISHYQRFNNGLDFTIDLFYHIEKMIELGYSLSLNIPQTLTGAHDNFLQTIFDSNQNEQIGKIKLVPSFSKTKFELHVEKEMCQSIGRMKNKSLVSKFWGQSEEIINNRSILLPFVVIKQKIYDGKYKNVNTIINSYEYKRINAIDASQIVQSYIFTKAMNASITRFFFEKNSHKSVAYKISNQTSSQTKVKFKDAWRVQENKQNSCIILKIMYENKSFYTQTLHFVQCLENFFAKEVSSIVLDWILDTTGRYYLIDVKQVRLVEPKPKYRISKSLSQLLSTVTCCMCLQTCNQSQISKILTTKLIINFYEHLRRRCINLSFRINFKKLSNFSRVCDLCYNLVVAETKLIELQRTMSQICNFKTQLGDMNMYLNQYNKESEDVQKMNQWRLFFYIEDIKNFNSIFSNDLKQQMQPGNKVFLNLQINDSVMSFQLKPPFPNNLTIKIIKIEYIFSEGENILEFLHNAEVRIQIVLKSKSNRPIAEGCIHGIYDQGQTHTGQLFLQRKYKQILLFNQISRYSILGMYIGLSNDGAKSVGSFEFTKSLGVFRPQNYILNCESLPTEWMQIIYQNYCQSLEKQSSCKLIGGEASIDQKLDENKRRMKSTERMQRRITSSRKTNFLPQLGGSEKRARLVL